MQSIKHLILLLVFVLAATAATADDLSGASSLLCSPWLVTGCPVDEKCKTTSPSKLNVPQFILIDLDAKTMASTEASGLNRVTPIKNLMREDGLIILQGVEMGRAFSFVISETTGAVSIGVALDGKGVIGFGACTPTPTK